MKLKQLALITTPEPRLLVVQPFDASTVRDIEKALKESKIGITPLVDGKLIRLPIPELSEERRKDLVKSLKQMAEEARVRVRANRRAAMDEAKKMEKAGEATEDQLRDTEDGDSETDRSLREIDRRASRAQGRRGDEGVSGRESVTFPTHESSILDSRINAATSSTAHRFHATKVERTFAQETRAAFDVMPDDPISASQRTRQARFGRTKNRHDRNPEQGREMHRAGIVRQKQLTLPQFLDQLFERRADR